MLIKEPYYYDDTPTLIEATDWIEVKTFELNRDPFTSNIIKLYFEIVLKCSVGETGEVGIFIDDEENPRAIKQYDLTFYHPIQLEIDTTNLSWGKHKITLCMRSKNGKPFYNTLFRVTALRFYTLWELVGYLTPIMTLQGMLE